MVDSTTAPITSADAAALSKKQRKEEGKKRKRQKIEEAGGVRPRKQSAAEQNARKSNKLHSPPTNKSNAASSPEHKSSSNSPLNNKTSSRPKKSAQHKQQYHRFGRVMDIVPCRNQPRFSTISIALPGSVVSNCQTRELKTLLVGQIARAATIYHVDEIVVFDDKLASKPGWNNFADSDATFNSLRSHRHNGREMKSEGNDHDQQQTQEDQQQTTATRRSDPHTFMARVLQYCECPQYLRKQFFPMHPDLQFTGLLAPIDAPHHVRVHEKSLFREGVVLEKKGPKHGGSLVQCGLRGRPVEIDVNLSPGIRCTVQIEQSEYENIDAGPLQGKVVAPSAPRERNGTYWGYTTRLASSLQAVFDDCPFGKYDLKIGASERGDILLDDEQGQQLHSKDHHQPSSKHNRKKGKISSLQLPQNYKHAIIVFGGVSGIEECIDADESIPLSGTQAKLLFDKWINICPYQGSRTIRTEEAVMISLAKLSPLLIQAAAKTNDGMGREREKGEQEESESSDDDSSNAPNTAKKTQAITFSDDEPSEESSDDDED